MTHGEQAGFTIIEVTLFLAISGLLLMIAFAFTGSTLQNMRFTDTTKSLQSFLQQQYTKVQTNSQAFSVPEGSTITCVASGAPSIQTGTRSVGSSQSCILLGSALEYDPAAKSITVNPVVGYANATSDTLVNANPQVLGNSPETYNLLWQATIPQAVYLAADGSSTQFSRILILRDTKSENISYYTYNKEIEDLPRPGLQGIPYIVGQGDAYRNRPALLCVQSSESGSMRGAVRLTGNGTALGIGIDSIVSSVVPQSETFFDGGLSCA